MAKRVRRVAPRRAGARRAVDKELKLVTLTNVGTTQRTTTLKTTTFPCTIAGLRWNIAFENKNAGASEFIYWAIVIVHDGQAVSAPATSDAGDFYTPEQNVLAFGIIAADDFDSGGNITRIVEGQSKTMRKLRQGDLVMFTTLGITGTAGTIRAIVQFFCKT